MTASDRFAAAREGGEELEGMPPRAGVSAGFEGGGSSSSIGSDTEIEHSPLDAVAVLTAALADARSGLQP